MEMQMESIPLQENNMRPRDDRVLSAELHNSPILAPLKVGILKSFWGINVNLQQIDNNTDQLNPYFSYYSEQCHLMLGDGGRHAAARTHCDISNIIQQFKQQTSREKIIDAVLSDSQLLKLPEGEHMIQGSINLAARLYLMMSFGVIPNAFTPARPLYWTTGSAQDFLAEQLGPTRVLGSQAVKFPKLFNGRNIERLGGIRIEWTSDLDQHLRIIHDEEGVAIFHHAAFLRLHQERYCVYYSNIFPEGFIDETLKTLALLFPQSSKPVKKWIQSLPISVDKSIRMCGSLGADARRIENFKYWHDRLVVLKQVFDEAEPGHLWNDRRRPVQWYTLWTAVLVLLLTLFFGFVQCVEGAFQVWKAYYPN